jgi:hypothetical protein
MTILSGAVRSKVSHAVSGVRPSIREVCLVGVAPACSACIAFPGPTAGPDRGGAWVSGGRVTWSGRAYRVESTQVEAPGTDEPFCYVHLSALHEG